MQDQDLGWDVDVACQYFGGTKPINPSTLYRGIKAGRYPRPYKLSPGISRWVPDECRAARQKFIAERDAT